MAEWKPLPGFEEHYLISDEGQVARAGAPTRGTRPGLLLRHRITTVGYPTVMVCVGGKTKVVSVHRAVLIAFGGPPPFEGAEVDHIDGVRKNCRLTNLRWVTPSENRRHAYGLGNKKRKLSEAAIAELRALYATGQFSQTELAQRFGVTQMMVSLIVREKVYTFAR